MACEGKAVGAVAGRIYINGSKMIRVRMKELVGVEGDDDVWGFYPNHISCRKWRS